MSEKADFQKARRRLLKAGIYIAPAILSLSDFLRYAWAQTPSGGPPADVPVDVPVDVRTDVPVEVQARFQARVTVRAR